MSRRNIPAPIRRLLIPLWNEAHRLGWVIRDYLAAIVSQRVERCPVCDRVSLMLYRRRVIPPRLAELWELTPKVAEAFARKESCDCAHCGAKLRARRLAQALLRSYPGHDGRESRSIRSWVLDERIRAMQIAEINRVDGLHDQLSQLPRASYSDYTPGEAPGAFVNGVQSEDLTRLTYDDEQFDLVITSESLEHVPDLSKALGEIFRVLKPGGRHLFTIPQVPGVLKTFARARLREDGSVEHLATPICHPGGDVGYPVFTEFGADFPTLLEQAGFQVDILFGPNREDDVAQVYSTRKPGHGLGS
jgi:hypothetical protein